MSEEQKTAEQKKAEPKDEVVFGVVVEMMGDGSLRVRQSETSQRALGVHDVEYLLARADREALVQKISATVTARQMALAQQMRAAAVLQQADAIRRGGNG